MKAEEKKALIDGLKSHPTVVSDLNGLLCKIIEALPDETRELRRVLRQEPKRKKGKAK